MAERERASARSPDSHPRSSGPGHDPVRGGLRFLTELVAWVATPWALWPHSILLAIGVVVLLIGLPAVFSTPGDRPGGGPVAAPGIVTILLLLTQLVAASWASWVLWPPWIAVVVTALCFVVVVTEQPRWHALTKRR